MSLGPPPVTPAYLLYESFAWCQVKLVFVHELLREQSQNKLGTWEAMKEADEVVDALKKSEQPLAMGAQPGEINWPTMICAANAYAHMNPEARAIARQKIANGVPIFVIFTLDDPDLCDLKVLDDPEYNPEPWCIGKEHASALEMAVSSMAWTFGVIFAYRSLSERL